jgi:hypothetical protein
MGDVIDSSSSTRLRPVLVTGLDREQRYTRISSATDESRSNTMPRARIRSIRGLDD